MSFPLRADIYKVGNRYYRRNPLQNGRTKRQKELYGDTPDLYGDNDDPEPRGSTNCERESAVSEADAHNTEVVCGQETSINNAPIVCEEDPRISFCSGKWIAKVDVPSEFHTRLFGTRGTIRKNLEESTQCRLTIPRKGRCEPIEVKSFISLECVQRCLDRIDIILVEARSKARFTHFLSLPCEDQSEIIEAFERFKQSVLCNDSVSVSYYA
uniref:KH domain-containing protein n=1 Tax=Heterorhabditis bacteriophora TaxID=37862 RepID=A0A1I7XPZ6_HETBA